MEHEEIVHKINTSTRSVTIKEALGLCVVIIGSGLVFWSNTLTRLSVLENNQHTNEIDRGRLELKIDKLNDKIDKQNDKMDRTWELFNEFKFKQK